MTDRFTLSPRAQAGVLEIWERTFERWGIDQANTHTRQIGQHVAMLWSNPALGRACPEVRKGYYKFPSGSHVLFYRVTEAGIEVVRILHERMGHRVHLNCPRLDSRHLCAKSPSDKAAD